MSVISKLTNFVGGSLFREIKETAMAYFPPKATEAERLQFELAFQDAMIEKQLKVQEMAGEATRQLDERIAQQEGTAKDLMQLPALGRLILFLRGCQRPLWGFATMYFDFIWFVEGSSYSDRQGTALIFINILVLGFLFGERTILNVQPVIESWLKASKS